MKNFKHILYTLFLLTGLTANAQSIQSIIDRGEISDAYIGVSVIDSNGHTVLGINDTKNFTPASTLKTITTWLALEKFGKDFAFETEVGYNGYIQEKTLYGNFIIKSGGDPTLGSDRNNPNGKTTEWINDIKQQLINEGIHCVQGNIIIDNSFFQGPNVASSWPYEDLGNYYGAGAWSTNINENKVLINFHPTTGPNQGTKIKSVTPNLQNIQFKNEVKTNTVGGKDEAYVFGTPYQNRRFIRGTIPVSAKTFTIKGALPNPPYNLGQIIRQQLSKVFPHNRIIVDNNGVEDFILLKSYKSLPLLKLAQQCMFRSINIYADAFLRLLGKDSDSGGSIKQGVKYITDRVNSELDDGSGLSPNNLISPKELTSFIHNRINVINKQTLPLVSKEGTVKYLLRQSSIGPNFRLKSGSMKGILTYAGILSKNGKEYSVAVMINNSSKGYKANKKEAEHILKKIYNKL